MEESPKYGITFSPQDRPSHAARIIEDKKTLALSTSAFLEKSAFFDLIKLFANIDSNAVLVGGALRDLAMSHIPAELDIATNLTPERVLDLLNRHHIRVIPTGLHHGTVMAVIHGEHCEITTFRKSQDFRPQLAANIPLEIAEDLHARDVTINAVAFRFSDGAIFDPLNGLGDLKNDIVRACGDASLRFEEDPLRILRMIRFGTANGRTIDVKTFDAAQKNLSKISKVAPERLQQEFSKILIGSTPRQALETMRALGLFEILLPEIIPSIDFEQNEFHSEDVYQHTLSVVAASIPDLTVRLAALFHDFGKPHTLTVDEEGRRHFYEHEDISEQLARTVMTRFKYSHEMIKNVCLLVKLHMRPLQCGMPGVRRLLRDLSGEFEHWRQLKLADQPGALEHTETESALSQFDAMVAAEHERIALDQKKKLVVDGYDLMKLGLVPGERLGNLITHLQEVVIEEPNYNNSEYLLTEAQRWLKSN